jgi:ABC-type arginine/histidine transport system permease subunit
MNNDSIIAGITIAVMLIFVEKSATWAISMTARVVGRAIRTAAFWINLALIFSGILPLSLFADAWWIASSDKPLTGGAVFFISCLVGLGFWYLKEFEEKMVKHFRERRPRQVNPQ